MVKGTVKVEEKLKGAGLDRFIKSLDKVAKMEVLVGVPESRSPRAKPEITNAALMFIHTNGSPLRGIPARPVIEPAIEAPDNKALITEQLRDAAKAVLDGKPEIARAKLRVAGQLGRDAAKNWFTDPRNGWPPNTEATALAKLRKLTGKGRKELEDKLAAGASVTDKDISRPLIDTGALRNSIAFVIRGEGD